MHRLLFVLVITVLAGCAPARPSRPPSAPVSGSGAAHSALSAPAGMRMHRHADEGYAIAYPARWRVRPAETLVTNDAERTGTVFVAPADEGAGTALSEAKVQVAHLNGLCPVLPDMRQIIVGSRTYLRQTWSGVGAGNLYQGASFFTEDKGSCYVLTLWIHSCTLGPDCGPDRALPLNKKPLEDTFTKMVNTFTVL